MGAFSVIVQLVVEPMDRFAALIFYHGEENIVTSDVLGQLAHEELVLCDPGEVAPLVQLEGEHEAGLQHEQQLVAAQPPRHQHTLLRQQGLQLTETRPDKGACKY